MNNYKLSLSALVMVAGSSKGTQDKYFDNNYWYKSDSKGYESLSEYLVSKVLSCSNIENYVEYEKCVIDGKSGCKSLNFLKPGETFMSFQRLFDIYNDGNLLETMFILDGVSERVSFVKNFIKDVTGLDVSNYLSKILTLDMLTLNTDRHFNNLGVIINPDTGECKEAPIFDNGAALLSNFAQFEPYYSIEENIDKAYAMPFSSNFGLQVKECGIGLALDYRRLNSILDNEPNSRALEVLKLQIERFKEIIPDINFDIEQEEEYNNDDFDIGDE